MAGRAPILKPGICPEQQRLNAEFLQALLDVMELELRTSEVRTLVRGEDEERYDIALRAAMKKREQSKRELLRHLTEHGC